MIAAAAALALALHVNAGPSSSADAGAAASSSAGAATPAASVSTSVEPEKKKPEPLPLHATAGLTNAVGTGTFIVVGQNNPTIQSLLSLGGSAQINSEWSVSASERIGFEWTDSDGDTYNHQLELSDPRFGVNYAPFNWKDLGVGVSFGAGYSLPISMTSRADGSLGTTSVSARATWSPPALTALGTYLGVNLAGTPALGALADRYARAQAGKGFNATNGEDLTTTSCADGARPGDTENFACGHLPPGVRFGLGLGGSYAINDELSVALDLGYAAGWSSYDARTDGTTTLSNGEVVNNADLAAKNTQSGFGFNPGATTGSLGVSWAPTSWFTLTGGAYTAQPVISGGGSGGNQVRWFPLWDLQTLSAGGAYNNFSTLFIDTTFSI